MIVWNVKNVRKIVYGILFGSTFTYTLGMLNLKFIYAQENIVKFMNYVVLPFLLINIQIKFLMTKKVCSWTN